MPCFGYCVLAHLGEIYPLLMEIGKTLTAAFADGAIAGLGKVYLRN